MSDGKGCKCAANSSSDCGCGVDWTPQEVYDLRAEIAALKTTDTNEWKRYALSNIAKLEAENESLRQQVASKSRVLAEKDGRVQELEALGCHCGENRRLSLMLKDEKKRVKEAVEVIKEISGWAYEVSKHSGCRFTRFGANGANLQAKAFLEKYKEITK